MGRKREVFIVWFMIFLAWMFFRANFVFSEEIDEFVFKPFIFVMPVLLTVLYFEKKRLATLGFPSFDKNFFLDLYIGAIIGVVFAIEGLWVNSFKYGGLIFEPIAAVFLSEGIVPFFFLSLFTSVTEEILARGYLFKRLFTATNNQFYSAITSTFLFFLLHIPFLFTRLHLQGSSFLIYTVSVMLLGITNCYILSLRKTLTLPILIHTFWNMTVALYL